MPCVYAHLKETCHINIVRPSKMLERKRRSTSYRYNDTGSRITSRRDSSYALSPIVPVGHIWKFDLELNV